MKYDKESIKFVVDSTGLESMSNRTWCAGVFVGA